MFNFKLSDNAEYSKELMTLSLLRNADDADEAEIRKIHARRVAAQGAQDQFDTLTGKAKAMISALDPANGNGANTSEPDADLCAAIGELRERQRVRRKAIEIQTEVCDRAAISASYLIAQQYDLRGQYISRLREIYETGAAFAAACEDERQFNHELSALGVTPNYPYAGFPCPIGPVSDGNSKISLWRANLAHHFPEFAATK